MIGFPGPVPTAEFKALVKDGAFGAILFKHTGNIVSAEQTAELCREIKSIAGRPFMLAVDQEGGRVARLRGSPFTALPPMREIGARGDVRLAERIGRLLAFELRAVGFDWDFAPVLDVDTNPANPVIGDRSFHRDAAKVAGLGLALARGLEAGGVASCGKHFPGHGDTTQDSHLTLPRLPHDLERLRAIEFVPFRAYAEAGFASVMTAHVVFEAIDPGVPATMSEKAMSLLRTELGFDGVLVSDDFEMKAIADRFELGDVAAKSARAGVDLSLVCHRADRQRAAIEGLVKAVERGDVPRSRIEEALRRLDRLEQGFAHSAENAFSRLGSAEHRVLADGLAAAVAGRDPTEVPT